MFIAQVSPGAALTVWWVSLGIGVVVIVVVAILLALIVRAAGQIEATAADIWTVGQRVANNTIHIPMLHRTNQIVDAIVERALGIDGATAAIEEHALDCPG
jgi:Na+-transporting methylmalonyl-CoA/oxaloacetate decarboxylase gamma subunit